jgi:uncharacterized membrane protein YkgB
MGLVILATFFALPFFSAQGLSGGPSSTLYTNMTSTYNSLGTIQGSGTNATIAAAYLLLIAGILILIAGFVGIFPLGTGVLGVVGMAMITLTPYLTTPDMARSIASTYGIGYYVIWAASVIALGASFWHGKRKPDVVIQVAAAPAAPQQALRSPSS